MATPNWSEDEKTERMAYATRTPRNGRAKEMPIKSWIPSETSDCVHANLKMTYRSAIPHNNVAVGPTSQMD